MTIRWVCPYCSANFRDKEQLKQHLVFDHRLEMQKLAKRCRKTQTINWAAGWRAAFCGHDESRNKES